MTRSSTSYYQTYRRLLLLLLIFPTYKLVDAAIQSDFPTFLVMVVVLAIAIVSILYIEWTLKRAQDPAK